MSDIDLNELRKASETIKSMINRSKTAQAKFQEGTSQYTLQKNRIHALKIAHLLIDEELGKSDSVIFEKEDLEKAVAPIRSLISKSEKAKTKLKQGTWQYNMLESNITALYVALPLILSAISLNFQERISMKTLNQLISDYTCNLQQGEMQKAYKGILEFIGKLRADFIKKYPHYDISSIYQGYMDMSYFSLSSKSLKEKGLKIAIVYLHEKGCFQVWLSARNREISKRYESVFCDHIFDGITVFHDENNPDAIIECTLTSSPNFEEPTLLIESIEQRAEQFIAAANNLLTS